MKYFFLQPVFLLIGFYSFAQLKPEFKPVTLEIDKRRWGDNATQTITISTDESLRKVYTIVFKDDKGFERGKETWKKDLEGKWEIKVDVFKRSGKVFYSHTYKVDQDGKWISMTVVEDGPAEHYFRTPSGAMDGEKDGPGGTHSQGSGGVKCAEEWLFKAKIKMLEENSSLPAEGTKSSCLPYQKKDCKTQFIVFAGPSALFADHGQDKETFIGGHFFAVFNFTPRIGAGIDGSLHYKNIGDQKLTRSFLLARGQYTFNNKDNCDQKFVPDVHILAGLGFESFKYTFNGNTTKSSGNGFAFGAGAGFNVRLTKTVGIGASADYIAVKYKNNDEINSNVRVSLGATILFWEKMFSDKPQIVY